MHALCTRDTVAADSRTARLRCSLRVPLRLAFRISLRPVRAPCDRLRSKTRTAQIHEALLMVLCHNIRCLIHEMHELGINPTF